MRNNWYLLSIWSCLRQIWRPEPPHYNINSFQYLQHPIDSICQYYSSLSFSFSHIYSCISCSCIIKKKKKKKKKIEYVYTRLMQRKANVLRNINGRVTLLSIMNISTGTIICMCEYTYFILLLSHNNACGCI